MRRLGVFLAALVVLATSGCAPPVDIAAEKAAIEQAERDWLEATNKKGEEGAAGYASFAAEDAVWLPPNAGRIDGRDSVRAFALPYTQAQEFSVTWGATRVEVSAAGDLAYSMGTYAYSLKDAEGNAVSDEGKRVSIWKKQPDGTWKVVIGIFNSDLPPPGAA
ncbi:MAG: YybH family protein, partial [Terriglobia bacterium]